MDPFDVVVIGGGPGGYVAAIRASQLGKRTALIEKRPTLGGTCLNVGCIPSKALLDSSELYHQAQTKFAEHGITATDVSLDLGRMMKRKENVVRDTVRGLDGLIRKNKITRFTGTASFVDGEKISIAGEKPQTITAAHTVLATGSEANTLPFAPFGGRILSSTEALSLKEVPKKMVVVGGGVIGLELGSVYARLGSEVTVVEFMPTIMSGMDKDLSSGLQRILKKQGMTFHLRTAVTAIEQTAGGVVVSAEKKGEALSFDADYVLVSIGRRPYTTGLNLEAAGVQIDDKGFIPVDRHMRTNVPHIFAIGDTVAGPMLAHKAEEEGTVAAEFISGQRPAMNYHTIPSVVYTWPEAASVGKTEQELKEAGVPYAVGKFPFSASGRARAAGELEGFVKVITHEPTDQVIGIHMIGPRTSEIIAEAVVAMEYQAAAEDIARICHAHPTFSEPLKEAAMLAWQGKAIHI